MAYHSQTAHDQITARNHGDTSAASTEPHVWRPIAQFGGSVVFDFGNPDRVPVVHTSKPKLTRISRACERCRTLKAKCNGAETCDRCSEQDKTCTYTPSGRTTKEKRRKLKNLESPLIAFPQHQVDLPGSTASNQSVTGIDPSPSNQSDLASSRRLRWPDSDTRDVTRFELDLAAATRQGGDITLWPYQQSMTEDKAHPPYSACENSTGQFADGVPAQFFNDNAEHWQ